MVDNIEQLLDKAKAMGKDPTQTSYLQWLDEQYAGLRISHVLIILLEELKKDNKIGN